MGIGIRVWVVGIPGIQGIVIVGKVIVVVAYSRIRRWRCIGRCRCILNRLSFR
jgi:hypothetical protein